DPFQLGNYRDRPNVSRGLYRPPSELSEVPRAQDVYIPCKSYLPMHMQYFQLKSLEATHSRDTLPPPFACLAALSWRPHHPRASGLPIVHDMRGKQQP